MSETAPATTHNVKRPLHPALTALLLLAIVLVGGSFRFMSLNWDDFAGLHPDERFLTRNLLPLIGGALEFTPDEADYPAHLLIVPADETLLQTSLEARSLASLRVGAVRGTLAQDLAGWWASDDRVTLFNTQQDALDALLSDEITLVLTPQQSASAYLSSPETRVLDSLDSIAVQRIRCTALHPETGGAGGYFDTDCSPLNPHNANAGAYAYGTLPLFLAHYTSDLLRQFAANEFLGLSFQFQGETLVWRFWSAFFDVGSIILIFFIGSRMKNRWVGLVAAALYAFAPLAIQKAHFGTVNAITAFFVTLAMWAALRVQDRGRYTDFVIFGLALGAALAGRINVIPLAGVVVLAAMVYAAPALDSRIPWVERERLVWRAVIGVFIAGFATVLAFRIFNPYAFDGPSFFGIIPNGRWLADASNSSFAVSGASDIPPNWQWLGRASYLYPLKDMLLWGFGLATGVMAWVGWGWTGYRIARGREFALRNLLPFVWVLVYFGWIGNLWVMTMRYYLPLYSSLVLLAAWALSELIQRGQARGRDLPLTRFLLGGFGVFFLGLMAYAVLSGLALTFTLGTMGVIGAALLILAILPLIPRRAMILAGFVLGFSLLWALMFTNIYRHQVTRVQASRWVWENVPGDFAMQIEGAPDGTPLVNIPIGNSSGNSAESPEDLIGLATRYDEGLPRFDEFTAPASGTIRMIYSPHLADPLDDAGEETLYISISQAQNEGMLPTLLAEATITANFSREEHPLGSAYEIALDEPLEVVEGETYIVKVEALDGPIVSSGAVMLTEGVWDDRITTTMVCHLPDGLTYADDPRPGLASYQSCDGLLSAYALLQSYDLLMSWSVDEELKRESIINGLGVGDYLAITSNRFYDSETRNPARFPLTTRYYDLLFNEELGYELVGVFRESFEFGPFSVDDQHLPIYASPAWLNELEADEAFHVYDHPAVFVFRKSADYDHDRVRVLLSEPLTRFDQLGNGLRELGAQIIGVIYWSSLEADDAPTALQFPDDMREIQQQGGTWSERFDSDSILNTNQPLGVVVWWLTIMGIGVLAWPVLFAAFPRLADAGYGFARIMGLMLTGWAAWFASSVKVPLWSQGGLLLVLLLLAIISSGIVYLRREAMTDYLRQHWKRLLAIEVLALVLFVIFIGVRLVNPDLWHHPMGGEKPMDFAYFNATLRSTIFPAYDPWFAGGYINYYYVGYVIVGVPVLLLKIVPAFAYNLLIPTLFSATGLAAFSVAFNVVAGWQERRVREHEGEKVAYSVRPGNPWVAGFAALLLCVVLGNLDIPRVVLEEGVARLGGYTRPTGLREYLVDQYVAENGTLPDGPALQAIAERVEANYITDNIAYEVSHFADRTASFFRGLGAVLQGNTLPLGSNRWYWGPTRVLSETPGVEGGAITEIPYFTFLYGDLHAHMINLPFLLFALLFVGYEVVHAQRDRRNAASIALALFLGALTIGMMRAVNTWDWPSFLLLGIVGLGYAWWRRWMNDFEGVGELLGRGAIAVGLVGITAGVGIFISSTFSGPLDMRQIVRLGSYLFLLIFGSAAALYTIWQFMPALTRTFHRNAILHALLYVGGFIALAQWTVAPYTSWYASVYNSVNLWEGGKTPLWAYFDLHGLFLFLIVSLMIWETGRWLRSTQVRVLRGQGLWVIAGLASVALVLLISLVLAMMGYQVALVVLPLLVWIAALFFRPGQSPQMQFALVLAGFGLALTLGVEVIVIAGDINRQNTVFKFYMQVWMVFSVAAGIAFALLAQAADRWQNGLRALWFAPLLFLVAIAAMYPLLATRARAVDRMVPDLPLTLDGLDYLEHTEHTLIDYVLPIDLESDYQMIRWLQENVQGTPVILEGRSAASEYRYNLRISINTGLPTVLGWRWHQTQQRTLSPLPSVVNQREANVHYLYNTQDIPRTLEMLRYYEVRYVIVGEMERAIYPASGLAKFDQMVQMGIMAEAFQYGSAIVYEVDSAALLDFLVDQTAFFDAIALDPDVLSGGFTAEAVDPTYEPDESVDISAALQTLDTREIDYLVFVHLADIQRFAPEAYDRLLVLEAQGVLQVADDTVQRRIYRVNEERLRELLGEGG